MSSSGKWRQSSDRQAKLNIVASYWLESQHLLGEEQVIGLTVPLLESTRTITRSQLGLAYAGCG